MADPSNGITFRTIQEAMPEYHISNALLDCVLTAMPPPPPGASSAWCQERLALIIDEVAARVPMDAAQGHLAAQCVLAQFLAEDMSARIRTPGLTTMEVRQMSGTADRLMCTVTRMERALERRQARVMPFRDVGAVEGFDLDALEGVWRRGMPGLVAAEPRGSAEARAVQQPAAPVAVVVVEPMEREPVGREPVGREYGGREYGGREYGGRNFGERDPGGLDQAEPAGAAVPGPAEPTMAVVPGNAEIGYERGGPDLAEDAGTRAGDAKSRAGVTLEQGDGWSVERWPAGAGARVGSDLAAQDKLARPVAKSGAGTAGRAPTGWPGSRGAA